MKKYILFLCLPLMFMAFAGSKKYWQEGTLNKKFDSARSYKVALLPVTVMDPTMTDRNDLRDLAYNATVSELNSTGKLEMTARESVQQLCNTLAYGGGSINASNYNELVSQLNVDLIATCQLSKEKMTLFKKEVGTVMAYIQIMDPKNGNSILYTGRGRSINPLSENDEAEVAVEKALEALIKAIK